MDVVRDVGGCPRPAEGSVVTIGAFDGVHLGHRALIGEVRRQAEALGARSAVVTFDRHPAMIVRPESAPKLLTDLDQKLELLASTGVDLTLVVHFDDVRSKEPAEDFVNEVLVGCLGARHVVVGADFHFGHQRRGNVSLLRAMGAVLGFGVEGVELVALAADAPAVVSSTAIRAALTGGDVDTATAMLGRPHEVRGVVERGDQRGRLLGFPTANVAVSPDIQMPADGIYAGWYLRPDRAAHRAAISLGRRPTFYDGADHSLLEAHLLDFDGDLYDEEAHVRFVSRLRGEERFETVDDLVRQMARDVATARAALGSP